MHCLIVLTILNAESIELLQRMAIGLCQKHFTGAVGLWAQQHAQQHASLL